MKDLFTPRVRHGLESEQYVQRARTTSHALPLLERKRPTPHSSSSTRTQSHCKLLPDRSGTSQSSVSQSSPGTSTALGSLHTHDIFLVPNLPPLSRIKRYLKGTKFILLYISFWGGLPRATRWKMQIFYDGTLNLKPKPLAVTRRTKWLEK